MYVYKIIEKNPSGIEGEDEFHLTHKKKYTQHEFEQIVMEVRNSLRPFITGYGVVDELTKQGFKELEIQAEDEYEAEN